MVASLTSFIVSSSSREVAEISLIEAAIWLVDAPKWLLNSFCARAAADTSLAVEISSTLDPLRLSTSDSSEDTIFRIARSSTPDSSRTLESMLTVRSPPATPVAAAAAHSTRPTRPRKNR